MSNFFDRFKPGAGDKKNQNGGSSGNPLAGWFGSGNSTATFSGAGQSLGGGTSGTVVAVTLSEPGPLGLQVEKSSRGTAIVAAVVDESQARRAGLARGDVLCFAGSGGAEEIGYDMFLELAASAQRPLCFEVRRGGVPPTTKKNAAAADNATATKNGNMAPASASSSSSSAEAYNRKQAVMAAAEKRERAHQKYHKPIKKKETAQLPTIVSTAERHRLERERLQRIADESASDAASAHGHRAAAVASAKAAEQSTVEQLGYNPYAAQNLTAGQARHAATASTHGALRPPPADLPSAAESNRPPAAVAPPPLAAAAIGEPSLEFQHAFETTVTSSVDHAAVVNSVGILRKLIVNATTKGQQTTAGGNSDDEAEAAKFRKVRLGNPKIRAAVTDMAGAVDVLLAVGFQLHADGDGESVLVFPPADPGPEWLASALQQMERYAMS